MSDPIKLVCLTCGRSMDYGRGIDVDIPPSVVRIEQLHCYVCWYGEHESEIWLDASGREVPQSE